MQASRYLTRFLSLILGWWAEVHMNRLVEGWPWCFPHHWHKTWNTILFWSDETTMRLTQRRPTLNEDKVTKEVDCIRDILWTSYNMKNDLAELTQQDKNQMQCKDMVMHSSNWPKGVRWLTKVDWLEDKLNTQLFKNENVDRFNVQMWTVSCH